VNLMGEQVREAVRQRDEALAEAEAERVRIERYDALVDYATRRVNAYLGRKALWISWGLRTSDAAVDLTLRVQVVERTYEITAGLPHVVLVNAPAWTDIGTLLVDEIIRQMRGAGIPGDLAAGMR
jgi:hypothetical protein